MQAMGLQEFLETPQQGVKVFAKVTRVETEKWGLKIGIKDKKTNSTIIWFSKENPPKKLVEGMVIMFDSKYFNPEFNNFKAPKLETISPEDYPAIENELNNIPKDFCFVDTKQLFTKYISKIKDPNLREKTIKVIKENPKFFESPASTKYHHDYKNGLLLHTTQMLEFAELLLPKFPNADSDLVYAGIMWHDLGKIFCYEETEFGYKTTIQSKTMDHLAIGLMMLGKYGLDNENLMHIIASHHGVREWGAIREPQTIEAEIVFMCDMLSTKQDMYR